MLGKAQKAIAQVFVGFEHARELGRDGRHVFVMNTASRHTLMPGLQNNRHSPRFEFRVDAVCDLLRQLFLDL